MFYFTIADTYQGDYKYCQATNSEPQLQCIPDQLQIVVRDVNFSLVNSDEKQNLLVEIFFENLTQSTLAVGYYNTISKQGKFLEIPSLNLSESLGQTDFTIKNCGNTLNIDFIEVEKDPNNNETLIVYSAKLYKQ